MVLASAAAGALGNFVQLYTQTSSDGLDAEFTLGRWDAGKQEWIDLGNGEDVEDDAKETPAPDPSYVILQAYKPEFLREPWL